MAFTLSGCFITASGGTNGASVDAWKASRFDGAIPAEGQTPPSGTADTAVSITGVGFGGPGSFQLYTNTNEPYYVRIRYSGTTYWQLQPNVINTNLVAGGQTASSIVDSGGQVFNVTHPDFGADPTGVADSTAAIEAAINACAATDLNNSGGTVYFPPGAYRITQTINLPVTNIESSQVNNAPQTPIFISAPLRITGAGGNSSPRGDGPDFGSVIYFDPTANSTLFNGVGEGTFEFDHMAIVDISAQENLFFFVNNTTTNIHDNAFRGNHSFTNAWTDVIQYGAQGGTAPRGDVLGVYQGQVSRLVNNACTQIRHLARLYADASNILFSANAMYNTCGTNTANDAAIICVGPGCGGNYFEYNDFEMGSFDATDTAPFFTRIPVGYAYAISFADGYNNTLVGNQIADCYTGTGTAYPSAQAAYFFSAVTYNAAGLPIGGSYDNVVMEGGRDVNDADDVYVPWAAGAGGANMNLRACPQFISGGAGGVMFGPVVRAGDGQFFTQAGTEVVTTNSSAHGSVTFPATFPNGLVSVICQSNGDNNVSDAALFWVGQVFNAGTGGFSFYIQNEGESGGGGPGGNVQIAVTWQAIGF